MRKTIRTDSAPQAIGPYSQAIEANGFLFVSGQIDTVVPPWLSFPGVSAISSREKLFHVFGRINGYSREYGHLGLVLGGGALKEVFPVIHQWIEKGSVNRAWQEEIPF